MRYPKLYPVLALALFGVVGLYFAFRPPAGRTTVTPAAPPTPTTPRAVAPPSDTEEERIKRFQSTPTRELLRAPGYDEFHALMARGTAAFDEYARVLADPDANTHEVARVLAVLYEVKTDRSRFRDATLARLGDKRQDIRREAVRLLEHVGGEGDTSPLAVMLLDNDPGVRKAAANTLAVIGGLRGKVVFDILLAHPFQCFDRDEKPILSQAEVDHLVKCRAKLEHRIRVAERKAKLADKK